MSQCPVCNAPVTADFGLTECEGCGAQLIVHVDGQVEHSGAPVRPMPTTNPEMSPTPPVDEPAEEPENPPSFHFGEDDGAEEAPAEENFLLDDEGGDEVGEFESEPPSQPVEVYQTPKATDSPDLSDIARFGNSDASSAREGALRYNLLISGIDTSDVREAFREAITDRKFMWDTDQILRSIRDGQVQIPAVAATKAYMLISRLRSLPVRVKWEQYALHQS